MSERLHLVHDVLDKMVLGRDKHRLGRVDNLVLEIRPDEPPRVVYMEMSGAALLNRLGRIGRATAQWIASRGRDTPRLPFRVAWDLVREIEPASVVVDVDSASSRTMAWERWLATHVVSKLGG